MDLKNKVALITGGAGGIGLVAAEIFAENGASVVVFDVKDEDGAKAQASITAKSLKYDYMHVDISDAASVETAMSKISDKYGRLDVLYNNASVFLGGKDNSIAELPLNIWDKVIKINLYGLYHCTKYAIPLMKKSGGGSIINTSSSAGVKGIPECDAYTASKGATISLTRSLAVEYGPFGIRTNCIAPAAIRTPMVKESNTSDPRFNEKAFLETVTPIRRWGTPEDVANLALFLASDNSSYVNGAIITADGGITVNGDVNRK